MSAELTELPNATPTDGTSAATAVLFVDDYVAMRHFAKRVLDMNGYRCTTAANAAEARELLSRQSFEVAVLDVKMPGESGLDLARAMKSEHPHIAVLMATSDDDLRVADAALKAGACGYLVKPFEANQLIINVVAVLERRRLELESQRLRDELERLVYERGVDAGKSIQSPIAGDGIQPHAEQAARPLA